MILTRISHRGPRRGVSCEWHSGSYFPAQTRSAEASADVQATLKVSMIVAKERDINGSGPWFSTQLGLSLAIGVSSFFLFCFLRTRWPVAYMPRTRLKGGCVECRPLLIRAADFSPSLAHTSDVLKANGNRFFGWIMPTLRTSDFVVLQTVGLDASVVRQKRSALEYLTLAAKLFPNGLHFLLTFDGTGSSGDSYTAAIRVLGKCSMACADTC